MTHPRKTPSRVETRVDAPALWAVGLLAVSCAFSLASVALLIQAWPG